MKVIIELNDQVKIENSLVDDTIVNIYVSGISWCVNIDDLKVALRKMTAK